MNTKVITLVLLIVFSTAFEIQNIESHKTVFTKTGNLQLKKDLECPITAGTSIPLCHYTSSCTDFKDFYCTARLCCYGISQDADEAIKFSIFAQFPTAIQRVKKLLNQNCFVQVFDNQLWLNCSCQGKCIIQADYIFESDFNQNRNNLQQIQI